MENNTTLAPRTLRTQMLSTSGQVLIEGLIGLVLLTPVLTLATLWYLKQLNRVECIAQTFTRARSELIRTQKPVFYQAQCSRFLKASTVREAIRLRPLDAP